MSYIKNNFEDGVVLRAAQLNKIDDQIAANEAGMSSKTEKKLLTYNGSQIKLGNDVQTYSMLYNYCMNRPDFVVLVYNDRAYHVNRVTSEQIVFITSYVTNGYEQMERISISKTNVVTVTSGNAEMTANKVTAINDSNKTNEAKYPSVKAVVDYVDETVEDAERRLSESFTPGEGGNVIVVEDYPLEQLLHNYFLIYNNYKNRELNAEAESFNLNDGDKLRFDVYGDSSEFVDINVRRFTDTSAVDMSMLSQESLKNAYDSVESGLIIHGSSRTLYVKKTTTNQYYLESVKNNGQVNMMLYYFDSLQAFKDVVGTSKRDYDTGKYLYQLYTSAGFYNIVLEENNRYTMRYMQTYFTETFEYIADVNFVYKLVKYQLIDTSQKEIRPEVEIIRYDDNEDFNIILTWNGYYAGFEEFEGYLYLDSTLTAVNYRDMLSGLDLNLTYLECSISDYNGTHGLSELLSITFYREEDEPYALMTYNNGYKNQGIKIDANGMRHVEIEKASEDSSTGGGSDISGNDDSILLYIIPILSNDSENLLVSSTEALDAPCQICVINGNTTGIIYLTNSYDEEWEEWHSYLVVEKLKFSSTGATLEPVLSKELDLLEDSINELVLVTPTNPNNYTTALITGKSCEGDEEKTVSIKLTASCYYDGSVYQILATLNETTREEVLNSDFIGAIM